MDATKVDPASSVNAPNGIIAKSLQQMTGAGQGDEYTPGSSIYLIKRDPARSIRRGRQLFQRKFSADEGLGPRVNFTSTGDITRNAALGAGLGDSCALCHGRPKGSAGFGGDVATRPDSRDAPHLFGLGIKEMLADEMTRELRAIRDETVRASFRRPYYAKRHLVTKQIHFGKIIARKGVVDTSRVVGVDPDLRVKPFFHERNYDGTLQTHFVTAPLWGVGTSAPYGHDGRSINLDQVIRRHGGEADRIRDRYVSLNSHRQRKIVEFLQTLVLFPPDDTASNLNPGVPGGAQPQDPSQHGSINLGALFQIPAEGAE